MKLEKEKIAFIVVLLLVGWLGWSEFSTDRTKGQRKSRGRAGDVEELDLTTLSAAELQLDRSTWDFSGRNVFRQPSELSPLPPLTLPVPPRTPLPVAPPATIPGPNPFHRLSTVTVPETIAGVRLPVRESSELFAESDAEGEADEEVEGSDTSEEQDPNDPVTVGEEVDDHGADPKAQPSRKILGLRERLQEEARARIEKQEKERMQARALQERRRTLDKLHWLSGETWYGHIDNESTRKKDAPGFDRYELKLRIDALRTDASLDARGLQDALADREMEIDFRRFDDKTGRLETRQQKMSPQNIGAIEFGESAINAFELAKRKTPPAAWQRHLDLARDLLLAEETGRAKRHLKWLVDEGHVQREVLAALAEAARRDFDFELETKTVKQGLAKFPDDPSLLAAQADILGRMGLDGLAEKTLERALELAPRSPIVNGLFGEIILESKPTVRGEHERAIDHLERARSTRIDDPVLKRRVDLASAEAELAVGRFAAARRRFEDLLLIHADDLDAKLGVAAVSYAEGKAAIARKAYEEVLAADPYLGRAWYGLGLSAMATGDWLVARDALLDAIASDPFVAARAQCALGWLYERIGARSESQAAYATAQEADPSDPEVLYWYGRSLMAAGDYQRAFEVHSRATEKMPGQFDLLVALAESSFQLQKNEDALRYLDAALELVPKSAPMLARRAQILARLRRFEESKSALDQAKVASESDEVELSLAWYYYSQGNAEEAVNRLRSVARSLDQRDESPVARYARTWSEAIGENLAMEVWEDHFNRVASGRDLLRGWKEHAPASGVSINLLQNRVAFAGTQRQTGTPSSIIQQRSAKAFVSFEAALSCRPRDEYTAGVAALRFTGRRGEQNPFVDPFSDAVATDGLLVAKTPEGRIAYRLIERNELGRWQSIEGLRWPDPQDGKPQAQNLGLAIEDAKKGTWRILFGGQPVGEPIEVKGLGRSSRDLQLWVFTQAEIDKRIDLGVDDVRIVTRND